MELHDAKLADFSVAGCIAAALPTPKERSVAKWAADNVKVFGARGESYDPTRTPWCIAPLECVDDGLTRTVTFVKPVQAGGSVIGEIALCRWIACHTGGDLQYNWEDDGKADERWEKRVEKILKSVEQVKKIWPSERGKDNKGMVVFPHCSLTMQGVFTESNVDSDSIRFQVNEEIHNWESGRLSQAKDRTSAYWNSVTVNISNASDVGDQLHTEFKSGTQEHWEVKCPGCGSYHELRTAWDEKDPTLGGLRYDSKDCMTEDGEYDYNKIEQTIRYQMPCGHEVKDDVSVRRKMSLEGRYGAPKNPGAQISNRSFTLEAVSVDYIPWVKLIQEKHRALHAMKRGDHEPYRSYVKRRECKFWDLEERLVARSEVVLSLGRRKGRDGIPDRFARYFALDRQQGTLAAGEFPHWWLVIRDAAKNGNSLLVWEGKCLTDEDALGVIKDHGCLMRHGVADSGDDTRHVYQFCLLNGINAIKGSAQDLFHHSDGSKKIYGVETPLHKMVESPSVYPYKHAYVDKDLRLVPHIDEPLFWHYSNSGLRSRFEWIRSSSSPFLFETPGDVSEDYKKHMRAWRLDEVRLGKTKQITHEWRQVGRRDDLHKCEQYIVMLMEMSGLIGALPSQEHDKEAV